MTANEEDAAITRAIITMAHGLNLLVTAEGVKTQEQMDFLKAHHCDEIQGYLVSRPVPAAQFTAFLIEHSKQLRSIRVKMLYRRLIVNCKKKQVLPRAL